MTHYHIPVLLEECISGLNIRPGGIYVDLTYGGGGHASEILKRLDSGKLVAFDLDKDALSEAQKHPGLILLNQNYRYLKNNLDYLGISKVDGILADLGVSSHQFDTPGRGFTFRSDAPLDMRMNRKGKITAAEILNEYTVDELERIFRDFAEIQNPGRFVAKIVEFRKSKSLQTSGDLVQVVQGVFPGKFQNKMLARVFQALRIEVNGELVSLREALWQSADVLNQGGRLVVIAYHSLEDRIVKNFMKYGPADESDTQQYEALMSGKKKPVFRLITKRVITPGTDEVRRNPRARSARLRIAEKL